MPPAGGDFDSDCQPATTRRAIAPNYTSHGPSRRAQNEMFNRFVAQTADWVQSVRLFLTDGLHRLGGYRTAACRLLVDASVPFI